MHGYFGSENSCFLREGRGGKGAGVMDGRHRSDPDGDDDGDDVVNNVVEEMKGGEA